MNDASDTYRSGRNLKWNVGVDRFGTFGEARGNPFPREATDNSENNRHRRFAHTHGSGGAELSR